MSLDNTAKQSNGERRTQRTKRNCAVFIAPLSSLQHFAFADESADGL